MKNLKKIMATIASVLLMTSVMFFAMQVNPAEALPPLSPEQPYVGPLQSGDVPDLTTPTVSALSFRPTTIGLGQQLLVNMWVNPGGASNQVLIPEGGFVITITKPDGTETVFRLASEPATFANYFEYTPDQVGEWKLNFEFIGAFFPRGLYYDGKIYPERTPDMEGTGMFGGPQNYTVATYFQPSKIPAPQTLTVQSDFVWSWPPAPLPTDYWTRPATMLNREWWPILGAWPGTGYNGYSDPNWDTVYPGTTKQDFTRSAFAPYVQGPNSAHVVWKRLGAVAGLIGGPAGQYGISSNPGTPNVIYAGRCYDTATVPINGVPTSCAICTDLRTGEYYYTIPTAEGGVTPSYVAYNNPEATGTTIAAQELGSRAWTVDLISISGSTLYKVDAFSGAVSEYDISPLSGGTFHNQIGGYVLTVQNLGSSVPSAQRYRLINWTTRGSSSSIDGRIISNTSYARSSLPTYLDFDSNLAWTLESPSSIQPRPFGTVYSWLIEAVCYDLTTGIVISNMSTTAYPDIRYHPSPNIADHGKAAVWTGGGQFVIFDGRKGTWFHSEETDYPFSSAGGYGAYAIASAYGMVFRFAYNYVYAFNWTDGKILWKYEAPAYAHFETPYTDENGVEVYSFNTGCAIADGKMYIYNTEHTPTYPLTRGWGLHCINITTGEGVWTIMNQMSGYAIADGYMVVGNTWDGYRYVFGRGQTATTVTASPKVIPSENQVMIEGSVLDMSPAQPGTPCVSKDSMQTQMQYLHMQQPIDGIWHNLTITGVPVTLTAIGSDGTFYDIGTTTTDGYGGTFGMPWTPPAEGTYTITAAFAADDSYGSSMATTHVAVGPATPPIDFPPATEPVDYSMLLYAVLVAVVIAIILAVVAIILIFRKK